MLSNLARRVDAIASWRRAGLLLLAYAALISGLTSFDGRIKVLSGGVGAPDLLHGFTADELYERFEAFGPEGRRLYLLAELVDLVYPLVYASFFAFLLVLAARTLLSAGSRLRVICLLPYTAMLFDYLENACFFTVLLAWPARLSAVATAGGVFNVVKWLGAGLTLPLVVAGLAGLGIRAARAARQARAER